MRVEKPDQYLSPYNPDESEEKGETSQREFYGGGTIPHIAGYSQTAFYLPELEQEDSVSKLVQTPLPSIPLEKFRGQTVTKWAIDRRRTAKSLSEIWSKASQRITDSDCAVYIDRLLSIIDQKIPLFRDIPYEDAFSGVLQLVYNALTGENFSRIQKNHLESIIGNVFKILVEKEKLDLIEYKNIHEILSKNQLLRK